MIQMHHLFFYIAVDRFCGFNIVVFKLKILKFCIMASKLHFFIFASRIRTFGRGWSLR